MTIKKWKFPIVITVLVCISTIGLSVDTIEPIREATEIKPPFRLKTIVLDSGHGGRDPGKVSPWGANEKDINLAIALKLAALIREKTQYEVYLTRSTDR